MMHCSLGAVVASVALALAGSVLAAEPEWTAPDGRTADQLIAAHVLPDPAVTPGVVNPAVTQDNIMSTICVSGWTATVRPPTSFTDKLRATMTPSGHTPGDGEGDHRLPIEDGGMPGPVLIDDPAQIALFAKNFWWEIYADRYGARVKDRVETAIHRQICSGRITLAEGQAALLGNWLIAYQTYVGPLPQ